MFFSPLRYPGGKNKLSSFIAKLCIDNDTRGHYIEPYAGGSSVALFLLFNKVVKKITINDSDRAIYAFWYSVLHYTDKLCSRIINTDVTIENWHIQKEVQKKSKKYNLFDLGFSTLFLNRTNMSGIINAGAIGGLDQKGNYKLDCRFNKEVIIKRIREIAKLKDQIKIYNMDAVDLIDKIKSQNQKNNNTILYFDPPYYLKGNSLYLNHYNNDDHEIVSKKIKEIRNVKWIVSYDNVNEIKKLYSEFQQKEYIFTHTAYKSKIGKEILFFSNDLIVPKNPIGWNPINYKMRSLSEIQYFEK